MAEGRTLVPGDATGVSLVLDEPLSLWGGIDSSTGELIDTHHPQVGETIAGRILLMPFGRGSSSSSYILAEAVRAGVAPAALILKEPDAILALGAIVARELYGVQTPIVILPAAEYADIRDGTRIRVDARGERPTVRSVDHSGRDPISPR